MTFDHTKPPFPWFGGKTQAAPAAWAALGDVDHYVEPFAGGLAVLLNRPHQTNRAYCSETVNDLDGFICNTWRAIRSHPTETAFHASWPVSEADLHARQLALVRWRTDHDLERLTGDPDWCDPRVAGWWLWGICCWIGGGWCAGTGAWTADETGRFYKQDRNHREPGVKRQLPHLTSNGSGVNSSQLREPGVDRKRPHLSDDGRGVNSAGLREPGVARQRPDLGDNGRGVNSAGLREPGVKRQLPHLSDDGRGVNSPQLREPGVADETVWHPDVMPRLADWIGYLSARLRHVRILNGNWRRSLTSGASLTLSVRMGDGICGVFLDPPYSTEAGRNMDLYGPQDNGTVAHDCRDWAITNGNNPKYRIVLAGYADEGHDMMTDHGWSCVEWFKAGFLTGGMGNTAKGDGQQHQQGRERLWLSPHCLTGTTADTQLGLFT